MARIEFAPDGKRWQVIKRGTAVHLWDYFTTNVDIHKQVAVNPLAKFRLYGDEKLIGVLPKK